MPHYLLYGREEIKVIPPYLNPGAQITPPGHTLTGLS